ncbi:hypothetical protein ACWCQM_12650 [Streptomyces sp. NPDC002125]
MSRRQEYRAALLEIPPGPSRFAYLGDHSGLPGPRGNIELCEAFADLAAPDEIDEAIATDDEYLVFCGVAGLGRLLAEAGDRRPDAPATGGRASASVERRLHSHAGDGRWRVREAVAMALQRLGDADPDRLFNLAATWSRDPDPLVQRAAVAGVCEPRLLRQPPFAAAAVEVCATATRLLSRRPTDERRDDGVRALRKGLGYGWSVAVAADPDAGLPRFLALRESTDRDIAWIVRENSRKARLAKLLPDG